MTLTEDRARQWAARLFPEDSDGANKFAADLLASVRPTGHVQSVEEFCQKITDAGGSVPASKISELFDALVPDQKRVRYPLVCIEYRDLPRADREGKYRELGEALGRAVARRVAVAMFMPFGEAEAASDAANQAHSGHVESYMRDVRNKCRAAFLAFRNYARVEHRDRPVLKTDDELDSLLRLYEHINGVNCFGSNFGAKMFFIEFDAFDEKNKTWKHHQRILQWLTTPLEDLLIYRGELHIKPEALKDSFYPIPHYFELYDKLPILPDNNIEQRVKESLYRDDLPRGWERVWRTYSP